MAQLRAMARSPEVAVPIGVLAGAVVLFALALVVLRPDATLSAGLITGVTGAYGTVISLILNRYFERQRAESERAEAIEREIRNKKVPVYEDFIGFWLDMLFATKLGKKRMTQQEMMRGVLTWTKPILMWGSDDVVRAWGQLRLGLAELEPGNFEAMFQFEQFLILLRRDAGYPDTVVRRGDLLRLWINDIDKYI